MKILVIGAGGMLGNAIFRFFSDSPGYEAFGSIRSNIALRYFPIKLHSNLISGIGIENWGRLNNLLIQIKPEVVINSIGLVKHLVIEQDPLMAININAAFPHRLAKLSELHGARLIHISTDCVFSGKKGMYTEFDISDAADLYGRTKYLGEVDYSHAITLRTSIIGHELNGSDSLIGWFLAQKSDIKGYTRAIFSGLPTVELARIIRDFVIPHPNLRGVHNVSSTPISKYELLTLVSKAYEWSNAIIPDGQLAIDRSLDSAKFQAATGYKPKSWANLVSEMHSFK